MSVISVSLFTLCLTFVNAGKICKVLSGGTGSCIPISKCLPLYELDKKPFTNDVEQKIIQQSMCGSINSAVVKVCCPPQSEWPTFRPKPIMPILSSPPRIQHTPPKPAVLAVPLTETVTHTENLDKMPTPTAKPWPVTNKPANRNWRIGCGIEASSGNKIYGGTAANIDQYPWLVLLEYDQNFLGCGGSLISSKFVLTASHCIETNFGAPIYARLGEYNTTTFPTDYVDTDGGGVESITVVVISIEQRFMHPLFNRTSSHNDIGLVKLAKEAEFTDFVRPICLPTIDYSMEYNSKTNFSMAGWGHVDPLSRAFSDVKNHIMVPYVDSEVCERRFPKAVGQSIICAGGEQGKDSCNGDSGGPLMYERNNTYIAVGVLSFGSRTCGLKGVPAVHINVFNYLRWIKGVMNGRI